MQLGEEIVLRPRFTLQLPKNQTAILKSFEKAKENNDAVTVVLSDDHVFLKIPKELQHFWSPQLDLEITKEDENSSALKGLFGPKPEVWTFFMFLHFLVALLFCVFGVWAYTNWSLGDSFAIPLFLMLFMVIAFIALYFAGSLGKQAGKKKCKNYTSL